MRGCEGNFGKHGGHQHTRFKPFIVGSSPTNEANFATIAPMVEQRIENSCVAGSSPACGTSFRIVVTLGASWFAKPVYSEMGISSILILSSNFISHWASGYASLFGTRKSKVRVLHGRPI